MSRNFFLGSTKKSNLSNVSRGISNTNDVEILKSNIIDFETSSQLQNSKYDEFSEVLTLLNNVETDLGKKFYFVTFQELKNLVFHFKVKAKKTKSFFSKKQNACDKTVINEILEAPLSINDRKAENLFEEFNGYVNDCLIKTNKHYFIYNNKDYFLNKNILSNDSLKITLELLKCIDDQNVKSNMRDSIMKHISALKVEHEKTRLLKTYPITRKRSGNSSSHLTRKSSRGSHSSHNSRGSRGSRGSRRSGNSRLSINSRSLVRSSSFDNKVKSFIRE